MSKFKENFLKCLPMLIVLASIGLFTLGARWIINTFYAPEDTVYSKTNGEESFTVVSCFQNPSTTFYIYDGSYVYDPEDYQNAAGEHDDAHFQNKPLVYFIMNEKPPQIDDVTVKMLMNSSGLYCAQFGEFILFRLEGQYGVFAPLRDYKESTTSRKNDLYVVRQLMKTEAYKNFEIPADKSSEITEEKFLKMLEKIEWYLDAEYNEDIQ